MAPPGSKLSDFVISSYTPTLTALLKHIHPAAEQKSMLLAVAQPSASGQTPLPGTTEELNHITRHIAHFPVTKLASDEVTVEQVSRGMEDSSWVHFACHGVQNTLNPLESALLLGKDSKLSLAEITQLSLPHAQLAFLSACQTATGDEGLAEEAVHLAAGMLLAGYRGVIATMWSIGDYDALQVADMFYAHLFQSGQPDVTQAAHLLHVAVEKLCCKNPRSFLSWVPFIHMGV